MRNTKRLQKSLRDAYNSLGLKKYLKAHNGWTDATLGMIDWEGHGRALAKEAIDFRVQIIKMEHDWSNVGKQKHKIAASHKEEDVESAAQCPACRGYEEPGHVWQCPSDEMTAAARLAVQAFVKYMKLVWTSPMFMQCLLAGIRRHLWGEAIPDLQVPEDRLGMMIHSAVCTQEELGWNHFLKGRVVLWWR